MRTASLLRSPLVLTLFWAAARASKDTGLAGFENSIRKVARRILAYADATDAHRAGLGITVRDAATSRRGRGHPHPPSDPSELMFLLLSTRTPAATEYAGEEAHKTARCMLRLLSTSGEARPWSEPAFRNGRTPGQPPYWCVCV